MLTNTNTWSSVTSLSSNATHRPALYRNSTILRCTLNSLAVLRIMQYW